MLFPLNLFLSAKFSHWKVTRDQVQLPFIFITCQMARISSWGSQPHRLSRRHVPWPDKKKPAYTISHWGDSVCWGNGNMRSAISPSGSRCQFHANLSQRKGDCLLVHPQKWASWSSYSKALENQSPCRVIDDQKHKCKVLIKITGPNRTLLVKIFTHGLDLCDVSLYFDVVSGLVLWDLTSAVETMWKGLEGGIY